MSILAPKLNVFQRLILQWEALHPYNAGQAMRLTASPTIEQVTTAWRTMLTANLLGRINTDGRRISYEFEPGQIAQSTIDTVPAEVDLDAYLSAQLNRPFTNAELPFRPFMCPTDTGTIVGLIYHHWVCDSFCVRAMLHGWLHRLREDRPAQESPLFPATHGYWHHFGPVASGWPFFATLLQQLAQSARMRRCRRIPASRVNSLTASFSQLRSRQGLVPSVRAASRRRGVKVNDLFLVAMARTVTTLLPLEQNRRRADTAIGSIVDLRNLPGRPVGDAFGLFLGFNNTILRSSLLNDDERLIASVAAQSKVARDNRLAQASQVRMALGLVFGALLDERKLTEFYRKRLPLAGGISNVTLHNSWAAKAHPEHITEYVRISPTGPFMPLVLTPTTLGDSLHLGITTRIHGNNAATGEQLGRRFLDELARLT